MKNLKALIVAILTISLAAGSIFTTTGIYAKASTTTTAVINNTEESTVIDISDATKWNIGKCWTADGTKLEYKTTRISLVNAVSVKAGDTVVFNTGNADFKFVVKGMNSTTNKLVKDFGTVDNNVKYTIPEGCDSLRISMYKASNEKSMNVLGFYYALTDGTLNPYIVITEQKKLAAVPATSTPVPTATSTPVPTATNTPKPTATSTPKPTNTPVPTATNTPVPTATSTPKPTATNTPVPTATPTPEKINYATCATIDAVLMAMLENGETNAVDVSRFKLTSSKVTTAFNRVIAGEGALAYASCDFLVTTTQRKGLYVSTVTLVGFDDGYLERYAKVKKTVADAMALIEDDMSEMDKALILHEFLMDKARYVKNSDGCYKAWGILANGEGVCMSYSLAYAVLLNQVGIEAQHLASDDMNHMWTVVKIDGQWYQVDATWDDTRVNSTGRHYYFMRTDNEFQNVLSSKHYNYYTYGKRNVTIQCTDTTYTNWFVHDVKGKMVYMDGYWYYANGNQLMKAHVDGSDMQVVASESSAVTVVKAANGKVYYKVNGTTKTTTK